LQKREAGNVCLKNFWALTKSIDSAVEIVTESGMAGPKIFWFIRAGANPVPRESDGPKDYGSWIILEE
jgi:hypothetical protein